MLAVCGLDEAEEDEGGRPDKVEWEEAVVKERLI